MADDAELNIKVTEEGGSSTPTGGAGSPAAGGSDTGSAQNQINKEVLELLLHLKRHGDLGATGGQPRDPKTGRFVSNKLPVEETESPIGAKESNQEADERAERIAENIDRAVGRGVGRYLGQVLGNLVGGRFGRTVGSSVGSVVGSEATGATAKAAGAAGAGSVIAGLALVVGAVVALTGVVAGIGYFLERKLLTEVGKLNGQVATAIGASNARETLSQINQANRLSDELSRFAVAQSELNIAVRELQTNFVEATAPLIEKFLTALTLFAEFLDWVYDSASAVKDWASTTFAPIITVFTKLNPLMWVFEKLGEWLDKEAAERHKEALKENDEVLDHLFNDAKENIQDRKKRKRQR